MIRKKFDLSIGRSLEFIVYGWELFLRKRKAPINQWQDKTYIEEPTGQLGTSLEEWFLIKMELTSLEEWFL